MKRLAIAGGALAAVTLLLSSGGYAAYKLKLFSSTETERGEVVERNEAVAPPPRRRPRPQASWPMFRYDERRTGHNPNARARPPFRIRWIGKAPSRGYLEAGLVVEDGILVVATYAKRSGSDLTAVNARTGRRLWRRHYRHGTNFANSPAIDRGRVYITSRDGHLRAFDLRTGRVRWQINLPGDATESTPIVSRGVLYFGQFNGFMNAYSVRTRRRLWRHRAGSENIAGGVALTRATAYFGTYAGSVYALNRFNGRLRWKTTVRGARANLVPFYSTPAVAGGKVVIGGNDGSVYALDARTGRQRWRFDSQGYVYASPAVWGGRVFIGDFGGGFHALSLRTGRRMWTRQMGPVLGSATVMRKIVYISSLRPPRTVGLSAQTGRVLWRFRDGQYSPVVADGREAWLAGKRRFYALRMVAPRRPPRSRGRALRARAARLRATRLRAARLRAARLRAARLRAARAPWAGPPRARGLDDAR